MNRFFPLISVICPTYNSAGFVGDTLASVLRQSQLPLEIVISDDGSTDETVAVVEEMTKGICTPEICILRNAHRGPGAARNTGIRAAKGDWIAFLDSDDHWHPEKIERVAEAIQSHPEANFFCHDEYHRLATGQDILMDIASRYRHNIPLSKQLFTNYFIATSAVVCKRDMLLSYNGFDETLTSAQDYELWLRMSPSVSIFMIPHLLGWYVDRPGNISSKNRWRHYQNVLRVFSKNRNYVSMLWYGYAIVRYTAVFCKNQLTALVTRKR